MRWKGCFDHCRKKKKKKNNPVDTNFDNSSCLQLQSSNNESKVAFALRRSIRRPQSTQHVFSLSAQQVKHLIFQDFPLRFRLWNRPQSSCLLSKPAFRPPPPVRGAPADGAAYRCSADTVMGWHLRARHRKYTETLWMTFQTSGPQVSRGEVLD